ncbi:glycosyltransferase [Bombilactobacillus bombi]|uniref:Glycosyltransferase n=1 Tax=Bombilactobacillus bombi TaxID=1303590 RepID=A0A347SPP9_9LACO|nr:glycosyltransferase family 2 protein [Bombilactobacillus bombi]AXX64008.1 glycosyltransferase [Bombilactobacillus bombi]MCO6540930.1 glycosyltransferase family 2 protein [Lactobacillus sp.]RHW47807.1 glycosyltransferase [Bombilactobacillus bombi]
MTPGKLAIVVPCYNEQEVLPQSLPVLQKVLQQLIDKQLVKDDSKIVFVDDGSTDTTWSLIEQASHLNQDVAGVKLSRNFGHQGALLAGLSVVADADLTITIDSDLQDDPTAMIAMVEKYHEGNEVVYGVRNNRDSDSSFKRTTAELFYKIMGFLGVNLVPDSADFRLLSQRATRVLLSYPEKNLFLRGLVPLVGFKSDKVYYRRHERAAGTSKYPLYKMLHFAIDGITSFSVAPIKLIMSLGLLIVGISLLLLIYTIIQKMRGDVVSGWSSLMVSIWALGGIQLICISVIGEYVGKIFNEVKGRPRFTIEKNLYNKTKNEQGENDD